MESRGDFGEVSDIGQAVEIAVLGPEGGMVGGGGGVDVASAMESWWREPRVAARVAISGVTGAMVC
jgi:hypothetical protein